MNRIIIIFLFFSTTIIAQKRNYDIVFPKTQLEIDIQCKQCNKAFEQKPKEADFSIKREGNNLYFVTNDEKWVNILFENNVDGLAIDVVDIERYDCEVFSIGRDQIKGTLLPPINATKFKTDLQPIEDNKFRVLVGELPTELQNKDLEYNILFLGNNTLCRYQTIFNLKAYTWDLLDMGIYLDSINYNTKKIASVDEGYKIKYKTLKFKIPFKKNKSQYLASDIKPLYDSLNLTDFNIKTINIKAYASIEGSLKRNIELQEQRSKSIVNALQAYQKSTIKTKISSSENWVEFLNDIIGTKYETLKSLNKEQLKSKLVGDYSKDLESILKNHRKAVVTLELEKKDTYKNMSPDGLVNAFNSAIKIDDLGEASKIQNSLFNRFKYFKISPDVIQKMIIPEQLKYIRFLNNRSAFKYQLNDRKLLIVKNELEKLQKLDPKNIRIKYNLTVLKFKLWRYNVEPVDDKKFKSEILALKNYGIDQALINRMMINLHIIKSEKFFRKRDYANKDKSVNYINNNYKNISLTNLDYFSLAQFLAYYSNEDKAAELLTYKAKSIDVDEDLLFYYLHLTLINKELTQTDNYRTIMLNAINLNKSRYCNLFNSVDNDGVTFQLLEDQYLRDTYCENCNE